MGLRRTRARLLGDHFDVGAALADAGYCNGRRELLSNHGLKVWAIGNHLVGQAVCDPIDESPPQRAAGRRVGRRRARGRARPRDRADEGHGARAAAQLGVTIVTGFTGSPIWHLLYSFPANDFEAIERGYDEFAERWGPIIDVYEAEGVRFALEVHPTEIAYDFVTTRKALAAIGDRDGFGINFDPSHLEHQFLDSAAFVEEFGAKIFHAHVKDSKRRLDGRSSILGGHLDFGQPGRGWEFVSPGHGGVDFGSIFRALNRVGTTGRCRSNGRTPGWTASGARATRWPSAKDA